MLYGERAQLWHPSLSISIIYSSLGFAIPFAKLVMFHHIVSVHNHTFYLVHTAYYEA